jgi:hypothetical protein
LIGQGIVQDAKARPALSKTGIGEDDPEFALIPPISQTAAMCRFWGWMI